MSPYEAGAADSRNEKTVDQMVEIYLNQKMLTGRVDVAMRAVLIFVRAIYRFDSAGAEVREAEIARLRAALEPFARYPIAESERNESYQLTGRKNPVTGELVAITSGDIRCARAALNPSSERTRTEP